MTIKARVSLDPFAQAWSSGSTPFFLSLSLSTYLIFSYFILTLGLSSNILRRIGVDDCCSFDEGYPFINLIVVYHLCLYMVARDTRFEWKLIMVMFYFTLNCSIVMKLSHSFSSYNRPLYSFLCTISKGISKFALILWLGVLIIPSSN